MIKPAIVKTWWFQSDSNPNKNYETLQYADQTTSCNCPGWTRRVDDNGNRTCKHTRMVQSGMADAECTRSVGTGNYEVPSEATLAAKDLNDELANATAALPKKQSGLPKVTKIHWKL